MLKPYTIRLFVPDGDPSTCKIITKMNWTGVGLEISRESWAQYRDRPELERAGIYILIGYQEEDDLPTVYIGQGDGVKRRIDAHEKNKLFWDKVLVFVSSNQSLNRAHITWLEWALIQQAKKINRCQLNNSNEPNEPVLTEFDKADTTVFLNELLSILPLVEINFFEEAKKIQVDAHSPDTVENIQDTIIVPAQEKGFQETFLGQNCWYAIRISGGKLKDIKYIAAYRVAPISAITHVAKVESIEPYGDKGKYKLNFSSPALAISEVKYGNAKQGLMQSPRYTYYTKLITSKNLMALFN